MKIEILPLGQLQTNCYLVYDSLSKEGIIIDPADEAEFIAEKIQQLKFKPRAILATHGHFDHILAAGELQMIFLNKFQILNSKLQTLNQNKFGLGQANFKLKISISKHIQNSKLLPFYIHSNDLFLLKQMNKSASYWLGYSINKPLPINIKFLKQDAAIKFGRFALTVLETPGHTPGSVCLYLETPKLPILFSGDTLFKNAIGRCDFSYSSKEKLKQSLEKIFQLPEKTVVYPGHGQTTIIKKEKYLIAKPAFK
jgi:glyoxylase-like metal-dependent hydrolase (beta-lactamase superfamily II)